MYWINTKYTTFCHGTKFAEKFQLQWRMIIFRLLEWTFQWTNLSHFQTTKQSGTPPISHPLKTVLLESFTLPSGHFFSTFLESKRPYTLHPGTVYFNRCINYTRKFESTRIDVQANVPFTFYRIPQCRSVAGSHSDTPPRLRKRPAHQIVHPVKLGKFKPVMAWPSNGNQEKAMQLRPVIWNSYARRTAAFQ